MALMGSTYVDTNEMTLATDLLDQLVGALELREEADSDSPSWLAEQEVRRLEHEIMRCLRGTTWHVLENEATSHDGRQYERMRIDR